MMGYRYGLSIISGFLSEDLILAGRLEEALTEAQRGIAWAVDCGERRMLAKLYYVLGDISALLESRSPARAEEAYRHGLMLATELGVRPVLAHCHLGLGKLYRRTGKRELAQEHLATATTMYREMEMTYWLEKAEAESRQLG
jgi:hypothetical protein